MKKPTHPLILWTAVLIQWTIFIMWPFNYFNLICLILTTAIAFAYTMWYQINKDYHA